nr:hypothetical protein CTI12_AA461010 [Tanacetum cinerariifolium]
MAGGDVNNDRVEQLENSLKEFRDIVQNSLQQITQTLATLTTHENDERRNPGGPRSSRNNQPQRQRIQLNGEDSDVEDDFEEEWEVKGGRFGYHRHVSNFDYRQRAKDIPSFHGSMNVEDFLDWMSELENFFKFYEIPMDQRLMLVAYKLKGGDQSWWKNMQITRERQGKLPITGDRTVEVYTAEFHRLSSRNNLSETESQQVTRYINGLRPQIHDKISLVPVYTLDDAYNVAIRAENQLARSSILIKSVPSVDPSLQHTAKISSIDTGKQVVSTNTTTTKTTNPYARPVMGKCFKCGVPGHRSNDCRANGGKVNLTLRDEEFDEGGETNSSDEDVDANAEIWHPKGGDYTTTEYSAHSFVIQRILLASKVIDSSQRHNLFKTRCIIFQKIFDVIIDNGSTKNIVSRDIVQRLRLPTEKHPTRRPWAYDVNATHKGKENTCTFHHDGVKLVLVPLSNGYSTNVSSSAKCLAKGTGSVEAKVKKKSSQ